ncbi:MAG: DUF3179 domain-containing protein [Pseudomonadota bacterium]|nr:DUF3179 domain-containing protein [Pseudomonadota bacterium]
MKTRCPINRWSLCIGLILATAATSADPITGRLQSQWPNTDFSRHSVALAEIRSGGPPKDGIPAIDEPRFVSSDEAAGWLQPEEPVIALNLGDQARAYPLQILIYHEIVNDTVAGTPVSVTFCPLCNAAIVYMRRHDGRVLDFGTTGSLRKSDMVMYDRQTESWWQQFLGEAIVGELTGSRLDQFPSRIVAFTDFRRSFPDGLVLSRDTGHQRPYGRNPYRGYDTIGQHPFLLDDPTDPRLPAMERVLGVRLGESVRLYPFPVLQDKPVLNDRIGKTPVVIFTRFGMLSALDASRIRDARRVPAAAAYSRVVDGRLLTFVARRDRVVDEETGSVWDVFGRAAEGPLSGRHLEPVQGGVHFAFAWLAFEPRAEIHGSGD